MRLPYAYLIWIIRIYEFWDQKFPYSMEKFSPERKGIFLKSNTTKRPKASFEIVYSKSSIIAQIFCHPELKIFESKI